ncbi:hypothetical protein ABPG74_016545 [Tetrahymena malaccensis]
MNEVNAQQQEQEEVSKVEQIINSKSFVKNQQDLYFVCDYLQGFTYINNQIKQYQGDSNVIAQLVPHLSIKSVRKGEAIYKKGQKNEYIYFIMKGKVSSWKSKSKESIEQEKNIMNQIEKLQKLIEFETQLIQDKKNKQENEKKILKWEKEMEQMKKQLIILQKYDFKLSSIFQNEDGINTACFEKIYHRKVDIFGYSNNLYNTRPVHTMIAESDCQFLIIQGEDFYSVFNKEVQKIKFLLRVLYSQFSSVDKTILLALAQQFKSMFYDLNQEIYSLNSQTQLGSSQLRKSQFTNQIEQNSNQIAFFIVQDGSILVKETSNSSDYNIFSLSQESIIGIEKYSPSFSEDFLYTNIKFISTSNKLQLLGITKKAIEEVQQTHNSYQITQTLIELGQQRSKFIIQHFEQIKQLLNPQQINSQNAELLNQQESNSNYVESKCDQIKNVSKYGFVNINQRHNNTTQKQNQLLESQEINLMLKSCQKNKKAQISFLSETENSKSQAYLKSIVNNMLKFRPSKQKVNSDQDFNSSPKYFSKQTQENNSRTKNFQVNKDSGQMFTKQKNSESQQYNVDQQKSLEKPLSNNYLSEQFTSTSKHIDKKVLKSKLSNQQSQDFNKLTQETQKNPMQQAKNIIKNSQNADAEKSASPRQLEVYTIESQNDSDLDLIQLDSQGNKIYEKYYRQLSLDEIGESTKTFRNQPQTNQKIPYKQQSSYQSEYTDYKLANNKKSNSNFEQKIDPLTPQQRNNPQKQMHQQQQQDQKEKNNQPVKMKTNIKSRPNSQYQMNKKDLKKKLNLNSFDNNITLNKEKVNERNNFNSKLRHSQDSLLVQEEFLAQELKLNEDFELKNGKLIQKKPPSFSDLREDFISSDNPYKQCADIIEKYKLISESNKEFIEKNCLNYYKQIQKQVDEYKQILILKKKSKHHLDKSNQFSNKTKIFTNQQNKSKIQNSQSMQTCFQTPRSQQSQFDSLNTTSKLNQNFSAFISLNRQFSPLISSESPLQKPALIELQSSLFQQNAQSLQSQITNEQQQKQTIQQQQTQKLLQPLSQSQQIQRMQNQPQTELLQSNNMQSSLNMSKFYNKQEQITERQSSLKQIKKIESIFQKCNKSNQNLKIQNSTNEAFQDYFNSPSNIVQMANKIQDNINSFNNQINSTDQSLIMIRSLKSAYKKQISRPQSVQINKFLQEKYIKDQALSFHIQQSLENSSFLPSNSYVNMMPSFEPKLQMNSINRPRTANNFKLAQNQHKKNRINMNLLNDNDTSSILQISSINSQAKGNNNFNQKQFESQYPNQFKIQSVFIK